MLNIFQTVIEQILYMIPIRITMLTYSKCSTLYTYPFAVFSRVEFFDVTEDDFGVSNGADIICVSCSFHKRIEMRFQTNLA